MKLKEIHRNACVAWSPESHHPIYLATGTAAQQLDATFSTTAKLEIFDLNMSNAGYDMTLMGSIAADHRFHKIAWGCSKEETGNRKDILVGGADGGNLFIFDPVKILAGENALVCQCPDHGGPVFTLDFNKFQEGVLASGSTEAEIFIWDLNKPDKPMTPSTDGPPFLCEPVADVSCVTWNWQVQHILASSCPSLCSVWDLRKRERILKVYDTASKMHCKVVEWHPQIATQLCIASDDDHSPIIQLWDLRFATSPVRTLESHSRGILSMTWCPKDPDLLVSCGKDNRMICWNPNTNVQGGEVLYDMKSTSQWCFDVAWCIRNPNIIASSSCDGHVSVHTLMGGESHQTQITYSSLMADSFPGTDKNLNPYQCMIQEMDTLNLKNPPKWFKMPVGASFGFGGKLLSFSAEDDSSSRCVYVSQLCTESDLLSRAALFDTAYKTQNLESFCENKIKAAVQDYTKLKWELLKCALSASPKSSMLSLLGFNIEDIKAEVATVGPDLDFGVPNITNDAHAEREIYSSVKGEENVDNLLSKALLTGNLEVAVQLCSTNNKWADALILAQACGDELLKKTQLDYFKRNLTSSWLIPAIATSNWLPIVQNCPTHSWKAILSALLEHAKPDDYSSLAGILGLRMEADDDEEIRQYAELCYIASLNFEAFAQRLVNKLDTVQNAEKLQDTIEEFLVLEHAAERTAGRVQMDYKGKVSYLLGEYCSMLANQGNLKCSLSFIGDHALELTDILKDRLIQALGLRSKSMFNSEPAVKVPTPSLQQRSRSASTVGATMTSHSELMQQKPQPQSYGDQHGTNSYQSSLPALIPSTDNSALGPNAIGHPLSLRYPKHIGDPSLYSDRFDTSYSSQYLSQPYGDSNRLYNPQEKQFPNNPLEMGNDVPRYGIPFGGFIPQGSNTPAISNSVQPPSTPNQRNQIPVAPIGNSEYGWNDPPPVKQSAVPPSPISLQAITSPLPGAPVPDPPQMEPRIPTDAYYSAPFIGQQQEQPNVNSSMNMKPVTLSSVPIKRGPIPQEHKVLQDTFGALLEQCFRVAQTPQIKRKLEDVSKKLEVLYDKLREKSLSANVVNGLHEMVKAVLLCDYRTALIIHGRLVSTSNFSEISSFMPSLKVLLGTAQGYGCTLTT